jgi:hypothetical protein
MGAAMPFEIQQLSKTVIETMALEQIQAELRVISKTPLRSEVDRNHRQELWRPLDQLVHETPAQK